MARKGLGLRGQSFHSACTTANMWRDPPGSCLEKSPGAALAMSFPTDQGAPWELRRPCAAVVGSGHNPRHTHTQRVLLPWSRHAIKGKQKPRPDLGPVLELWARPLTVDQQQPEAGWSFHARRKWGALSGITWIPQPPDSRSSRLVALPYPALLQFRHRLGPRQPPSGQPCCPDRACARFCSGYVRASVCERVHASVCVCDRARACVRACTCKHV